MSDLRPEILQEAVLIGATTVHKPFTLTGRWSGEISTRGGYGEVSKSACGRFKGIVYDRSLAPDKPLCKWCANA